MPEVRSPEPFPHAVWALALWVTVPGSGEIAHHRELTFAVVFIHQAHGAGTPGGECFFGRIRPGDTRGDSQCRRRGGGVRDHGGGNEPHPQRARVLVLKRKMETVVVPFLTTDLAARLKLSKAAYLRFAPVHGLKRITRKI